MKRNISRSWSGGRLSVRLAPVALVLGVALALAVPNVAFAHAAYDHSDPAADSTVATAPTTVSIWFKEKVNPQGSQITIYDTKGKVVSSGAALVDRNDATKMTVGMQGDDSEAYLVTWHNVSLDDGDLDTGAFVFHVGSSSSSSGGKANSSGSSTGASASSSGVAGGVAALIGIAGLVVGAAAGFFFARRQPR